MLTTNRGFWKAFFLNLITLGIYDMYLIYAFAKETNIACTSYDKRTTTGLFLYIVFNILTLGIYGIVWNCNWINRCNGYLRACGKEEGLSVSTYLLTCFIFGWLTLGIMYLVVYCKRMYLQNNVNETYNSFQLS